MIVFSFFLCLFLSLSSSQSQSSSPLSLSDLEYDSNDRLVQNTLLYVDSSCSIQIGLTNLLQLSIEKSFLKQFHFKENPFSDKTGEKCVVVGLIRGRV